MTHRSLEPTWAALEVEPGRSMKGSLCLHGFLAVPQMGWEDMASNMELFIQRDRSEQNT